MESQDTRQKILEAAERAIQEQGLGRVTTRDIARAAGLADGTLYVHFPHKEDLFLAVIQRNLPDFAAAVDVERAGAGPLAASLKGIAHAALRYYASLIPWAAALFADPDLLGRHRAWMAEHGTPQRIYERVAAYIAAEQHGDRIKAELDPLAVAAALLGPCFQYVFLRQFLGADPLPLPDRRFVTEVVSALLQGVTTPAERHGASGRA